MSLRTAFSMDMNGRSCEAAQHAKKYQKMKIRELISEIKTERQRQHAKWGRQRLSLRVWAWVWLEEVGEYCRARLELRAVEKLIREDETCPGQVFPMLKEVIEWQKNKDKKFIQALTVIWAFFAQWRPWHGIWKIY